MCNNGRTTSTLRVLEAKGSGANIPRVGHAPHGGREHTRSLELFARFCDARMMSARTDVGRPGPGATPELRMAKAMVLLRGELGSARVHACQCKDSTVTPAGLLHSHDAAPARLSEVSLLTVRQVALSVLCLTPQI